MFARLSIGSLAATSALLLQGCLAQLETVPSFGDNPTDLTMKIAVPDNVADSPAVILALHPCGGSADMYADMTEYSGHGDQHGFITIFPETSNDFNCWDVASDESLTRDGGGDSTGLANMIQHTISEYNADPAQIFVSGSSSGCMMTNVMIATYPDLFAAASCYSGVSAGCLAGSPGSSPISADPACASGQIVKTGEEWAEMARNMYPEYDGPRPKFMTLHGTDDSIVDIQNLEEQVKQWSTIFGVTSTAENANVPEQGYTQIVFGDGSQFVAYSAEGVGHTVPVHGDLDLEWFGITA